jgi:alpha-glucosidase
MPYLYTVFRQSHEEGLPVMRPVFFDDPADMSLRMEDQAFLLGTDVLVIPKWAEAVRLPKGIWRSVSILGEDAHTDTYQCDLRVRGGAIVPLGPTIQSTAQMTEKDPLTLIVVLNEDGQAEGRLYEDAGDGYEYRDGQFRLTAFTAKKEGDNVSVACQQQGQWALPKRLVSVVVIQDDGLYYGFGDIVTGVRIKLDEHLKTNAVWQ